MSKTTDPTQDNAYPPIQITKINNGGAFIFNDTTNLVHPIAPLASVQLLRPAIDGIYTLIIRATLYINTDVKNKPRIKSVVEDSVNKTLTVLYKHDFSETTPETCDVWYVEANYSSETANEITEVILILQGSNKVKEGELGDPPPTSRGTKVSVGQ